MSKAKQNGDLAEKVKRFRYAHDFSQTEFGRHVGLSRATIAKIEGRKEVGSKALFKVERLFEPQEATP